MSKYALKKFIPVVVGLALVPTTYFTYDGYVKSKAASNFELAASKLGFIGYRKIDRDISAANHQEALLKQLQVAGYFQPDILWHSINRLGFTDPAAVFKHIYPAVKKSKADQSDPSKFNAKILRKNLGKGSLLDEQDLRDLILDMSQNAFSRVAGQERNELSSKAWMSTYEREYLGNAATLRLIDREPPEQQLYDLGWIAGASRPGVLARIIDYRNILEKYNIKIIGGTSVLAGARPLWANIDGITPIVLQKLVGAWHTRTDLDSLDISLPVGDDQARIAEGREYMLSLAAKNHIRLNSLSPFIQYKTKEESPSGYFPGRVYPNYAEGETRKLTETLMSQDLVSIYLVDQSTPVAIVDTQAIQHQRPTTMSTARDASKNLAQRIMAGEYGSKKHFVVLFQTNNPYIERQTIAAQREASKIFKEFKLAEKGYTIKVEGVGFKCKQDVTTIHSELAALVAEKWKSASESELEHGVLPKRKIESLLYQTRDNSATVPPVPDVYDVSLSRSIIQDFFDEVL